MPLVYASVAGTAFQLTDHRGELESKLSAYTSMAAEACSISPKTTKGETDADKNAGFNRSDSPTQQVVQNLTGFKLIGDDWNSAQVWGLEF